MSKLQPDTIAPLATAAVVNRQLMPSDQAAVSALHARVFGPGRFARTAYRVREGTAPFSPFCRGAFIGDALIASIRMSPVAIGASHPHLLLGPLAVTPEFSGQGYGKALVEEALTSAQVQKIASVILVGDMSYYARFDFAPVRPGQITFPGPVNPARILGRALQPGALDKVQGTVAAITL